MEVYSKKDLIHMVAEKSRFTVSDITIILENFEKIVKEIIYNENAIYWTGFFKMWVGRSKTDKRFHDLKTGKMNPIKPFIKIHTTISRDFVQLVKRHLLEENEEEF